MAISVREEYNVFTVTLGGCGGLLISQFPCNFLLMLLSNLLKFHFGCGGHECSIIYIKHNRFQFTLGGLWGTEMSNYLTVTFFLGLRMAQGGVNLLP